jgi:outer membrane autotransporter protein
MSVKGIRRFFATQGWVLPARAFHSVIAAVAVAFALLALPTVAAAQTTPGSQTLVIQSGNGQSALPFQPLPNFLAVLAEDNGLPAENVTINWAATNGAVLSATTTTTTFAGLAGVFVLSVGPSPGPVIITATRADSGASVTFIATVLTPQLAQVSGNGQSAPTDTALPAPLVVRALLSGVGQAGITINWTVTSGDATIGTVANGGVTDASGFNSATINLGPTPGPITVSACRADFPTVCTVFTANSTLTRTLTIVSGDGQTAPPNAPVPSPLLVNAQDNGAPASGVTILWSISGGGTLNTTSNITGALGNAQARVTSTGPGPAPIQVTATRSDDPTATVTFTVNILPPTLSIISGDGQTGFVNRAATAPLEVQLLDGAGQPVVGQAITWQVIGGSASLTGFSSITDGLGKATMTYSFGPSAGAITIRASAYGGAQFVDFSATSTGPSGGGASGGNGQSGAPGSTLPTPLTVTITGTGPDLSGVQVTWTVISGSATVSPTVSFTDAAGQASTTLTLGLTPGPVVVQAAIAGDGTVLFNATVTGTLVATTLTAVSGGGQTLSTGQVSAPMVVELKDGATPLSGMTITWTTDNGSIAFSTVTDAAGQSSNTVTPSVGGPVNVTANFAGFAAYTASSTGFAHNASIASTPSLSTDEVAVAEALDSACASLQGSGTLTPEEQDLLDQCLALNAAAPVAIAEALEEMLPDVAEAQARTGQTAVNAQFDNLKGRMAALRSGATGANLGGLTLVGSGGSVSLFGLAQALMQDEEEPSADAAGFSRWGFFASGSIGRGEADAEDNVPSYDFDINGITVGVDYRKTDSLVIGAALGYTRQDTDLDNDQGSVEMRGFSVSGYASWYLENSWYVDGSITLGRNRYDNARRIQYVLPGEVVDTEATADFDGNDRSLSLSFGRDFAKGAWGGGVWGRMLYSRLGYDEFEEDVEAGNGMGLGLRVESRTVTSLSSVLGGRLTYTHSADWGVAVPTAQFEWQKEHRSDPETFQAVLIDDPTGTPILVTGEPFDSSYFRVGLGVSLVLTGGRSGFVLYEKMLGRDGMDLDNLTLGFRMEF